jgi:exodeoxyribonuclease V alpha subunit
MKPNAAMDAAELLASGFAEHVVRWATDKNGTAVDARRLHVLRRAAFHVSLATGSGHACALLTEIFSTDGDGPDGNDGSGGEHDGVRQMLLHSGVVGSPEAPGAMPLILDSAGRLYLHRYFDYEQRLARRLLVTRPPAPIDAHVRAQLHTLFAANQAALAGRPDWQQIAAALALRQSITVISGGPGTGKTTTVVNILACLLAQNPACRIALAAPTGKAAARMLEALRARAGHLPPAIRDALPQQSHTVHRLLGVTPTEGVFRHHAGNLLALDVLLLDEASMLDLALAVKLFEAVPPGARIVLLGDKDQLAAVESGAVFAELCADPALSDDCIAELAALTDTPAAMICPPPATRPTRFRDGVIWFTENFRFHKNSGIGLLARGIGDGEPAPVLQWLQAQQGGEVGWIDDGGEALAPATLAAIADGYAGYLDALRCRPGTTEAVFAAYARFRVLCAVRHGARGVAQVNQLLENRFKPLLGATASGSAWYAGRPVIITRNDYTLRLFNGDIGIALPDQSGALMVYFADAASGFRALAPARVPAHETAFAMTIHKSQGSEFEHVLLLLPHQPNRGVTRELLYTGVTRARRRVDLAAPAAVLEHAIRTLTQRHSGLLDRMEEIAAEA